MRTRARTRCKHKTQVKLRVPDMSSLDENTLIAHGYRRRIPFQVFTRYPSAPRRLLVMEATASLLCNHGESGSETRTDVYSGKCHIVGTAGNQTAQQHTRSLSSHRLPAGRETKERQ
eukprot:GHVU01046220.1.p5 GENE.GHVU01046220.1~~GHVU01046220.1.p5  ORF type:complete len:117 (+),score=8.26 GHVU01046220.1:823-1173(+)